MAIAGIIAGCLFSCLLCLYLLRLAGDQVSELNKEAEPPEEIEYPGRGYLILSCALILATGLFRRFMYGDTVLAVINCVLLLAVLFACAWSDAKVFIIPNRILLVGLVFRGLTLAVECLISPSELRYILLSCLIASGGLFLAAILCRLISPKAVGAGDIKLMVVMGLYLTTDRVWSAILLSMIATFFFSLFLVIVKKANRKTEIPFAPLLLIGTLLSFFLTTV